MKTSPAHYLSSATLLFVVILRLLLSPSASHALSSPSSCSSAARDPPPSLVARRPNNHPPLPLPLPLPLPRRRRPDWSSADTSLRDPSVCVASPAGLDGVLAVLRDALCGDDAHADLDLRMRVRCPPRVSDDDDEDRSTTLEDCARIIDAVAAAGDGRRHHRPPSSTDDGGSPRIPRATAAAAALALAELARGVSSLADASFVDGRPDVHVRAAIASDYRAIDPMFHTDKCPLRAYVTFHGPGTEFVGRACRPWEYAALRAFGVGAYDGAGLPLLSSSLPRAREAGEMEFIVMKGDRYVHPRGSSSSSSSPSSLWGRSSACVHRSPPGSGGRRVILSLDLANGEDEREWHEAGRKREWRSGMTQKKGRLVS